MDRKIKIPKKIDPCPIVNAVIELRFTSVFPSETILGIVYNKIKEEFKSGVENLPILQLPEKIRISDPKLIYAPWYKMRQGNFVIQLGPKVLSFVNENDYIGWSSFYKKIESLFNQINEIGLFDSFSRIGLRYINSFDIDVFSVSTLSVNLSDHEFQNNGLSMRSLIEFEDLKSNVSISNNAQVKQEDNVISTSLIDIDSFFSNSFTSDQCLEIIDRLHHEEKVIFFNLLKDEYIKSLNPEY
jgi:uncharacterized protein (TIGR04255 family)